ncbi:MAG: signal recognition particle protein [Myxococcota bacterium]
MLEVLSNGFKSAKEKLTGKATLDESNIKDALRDVRLSLLQADVEYHVVKDFLKRVEEKAVGELVVTRVKDEGAGETKKLSPEQHFINICHDELEALMGPVDTSIAFRRANEVTTIMMVGLQGAGKTTTTGKLARKLQEDGHSPMLVAADIYRPAAIDQLQVLGKRLGVPVYTMPDVAPPDLCDAAIREAKFQRHDVVIFDTAGRLTIDEVLMEELSEIRRRTSPDNIFLVLDAMTGQDAVKTAASFDQRLDLSGVILTKLDGDARGGAALSVKQVTGKPIKFLGMGEGLEALEEFRPDGLAGRILGFGDIVGLVKDFEKVVDEQKAEEDAQKILSGDFNMMTFLEQIRTIKKMGSIKDVFEKMPFFSDAMPADLDDKQLVRVESIILSMTKQERRDPEVMTRQPGRLRRIARGSGTTVKEAQELVQRFFGMRNVMKQVGQQPGLLGKLPGFKQLGMLKQMRGGQMEDFFEDFDQLGMGAPGVPGGGMGLPNAGKGRKKRSKAEMQARVEARKKRRQRAKAAAKSRKKNRKKR